MEPKLNYEKPNFSPLLSRLDKMPPKEKQILQNKVKSAKYSEAKFSTLKQTVNDDNKRLMESGVDPSWLLEMSAKVYAQKAVEKSNLRWLGMIETIETKYGNYAQTIKGRELILKTTATIRANQNAEEEHNAKWLKYGKTKEKEEFRKDAGAAYELFKTDPDNEDYKKLWADIKSRSLIGGYDQILSGLISNIDNINKVETLKHVSDIELNEILVGIISDEKTFKLGNTVDASVGDITNELLAIGITVKPEQRPLLEKIVSSFSNTQNIPFFNSLLKASEEAVDNLYLEISTIDRVKDLVDSPEGKKEVARWKQVINERFNEAFRNNMKKASEYLAEKSGKKGGTFETFMDWDMYSQGLFETELNTILNTINSGSEENPNVMYNALKQAYDDDEPTSSPQRLSEHIAALKKRRSDLQGDENRDKEGDKEIAAITTELERLEPTTENAAQKSTGEMEERKRIKTLNEVHFAVTMSKHTGAPKSLKDILEKNAGQTPQHLTSLILKFKANNQVEFGTRIEDYVKNVKEAMISYDTLNIYKVAERNYNRIVFDATPGWTLGALASPSLGLDSELKLTKVERAQRVLIIETTRKVREHIQESLYNESVRLKMPWEMWSYEDQKAFNTKIDNELYADEGLIGKTHKDELDILGGKAVDKTPDHVSTIFRTLKYYDENKWDALKSTPKVVIGKIRKLGDTTTNQLYIDIGEPDKEGSDSFENDYNKFQDDPRYFQGMSKEKSHIKWKKLKITAKWKEG